MQNLGDPLLIVRGGFCKIHTRVCRKEERRGHRQESSARNRKWCREGTPRCRRVLSELPQITIATPTTATIVHATTATATEQRRHGRGQDLDISFNRRWLLPSRIAGPWRPRRIRPGFSSRRSKRLTSMPHARIPPNRRNGRCSP